MIAVVYRWRLKPDRRDAFAAAWAEATGALVAHGSMGSALFEGPDGVSWAIARWPDAETRARAFASLEGDVAARMEACVQERFDAVVLDLVQDLWDSRANAEAGSRH
jgi:hypothetical protein